MNALEETAPDANAARAQRRRVWNELVIALVYRGVSTGSKILDKLLLLGRDTVEFAQNVYRFSRVPTPAEHFLRQDPGEAGMIFRQNLMVSISDDEFTIGVLDALGELGIRTSWQDEQYFGNTL